MRRYSKKRDANEPEIIKALRGAGAAVQQLNQDGVPDLLVGYMGETYLLEVKPPLGPRGGTRSGGSSAKSVGGDGVLTEAQVKWWAGWQDKGADPIIVRTPDEALAAIGVKMRKAPERYDVPSANYPFLEHGKPQPASHVQRLLRDAERLGVDHISIDDTGDLQVAVRDAMRRAGETMPCDTYKKP